MRAFAAAFFFLLFSVSAGAAQTHWEFAGWEGGGCYPNIEFDPAARGRVYLTSDVAGLWKSDDLGEHWRFATQGLTNLHVSMIAIAPSDPKTLYAGTAEGIFYSADGAESWSKADDAFGRIRFERPENYRSIAVSKTDPKRLIAGTVSGEVFFSEDSGQHWKLLGDRRPFGKISPISVLAWLENENILLASSGEGFAKFEFKASRWEYFQESPKEISDFWVEPTPTPTVYAAGQNKIFISRDGGKSWKLGPLSPSGVFYRLLVPGPGKKTILAAWNDGWKGGVVRSDDEGQSWKPWDKTMESDPVSDPTRAWAGVQGRINALKADPFDPQVIFRTDWWGVWRSDDGGVTWKEKIKGAPNTVVSDIALSPEGNVYVATMDNGLLKSDDGGKNYRPLFPAKGYADDINGHVWRVKFSGNNLLATSTAWGLDRDQVIMSRDGGASFEKIQKGLPAKRPRTNTVWKTGYARAIAAHPKTPDIVYLGIDGNDGGGFFVSRDGGRSWERPQSQPASLKIYNALAVDPEDPNRILWGTTGKGSGVHYSEDGGKSWRRAESPAMEIYDIAFGASGRAYAAGGDTDHEPSLYISEDAGRHWKLLRQFDGKGSVESLCVLPDGRVAAGVVRWNSKAPGFIYLSSPDGNTWDDIDGDLPPGEGPSAMAYDEKNKTLYMGRTAGSVYKTEL